MSELNAEKMAMELSKRGHEWAENDAAYYLMEETSKSILSQCIAMVNDQDASMAAKEAEARRSAMYIEHLESKATARKNMNMAKVNYDTYKAYMELRRSEEATHRAAMTLR